MMLYPYHISDIVVRGLRVTPFNYYQNMLVVSWGLDLAFHLALEFIGVDAIREKLRLPAEFHSCGRHADLRYVPVCYHLNNMQIAGIGRNQYIELMNQNRATRRMFRRSKSVKGNEKWNTEVEY